jgi:hypothetical protein
MVGTGREALRRIKSRTPEMVGTGREALRRIKSCMREVVGTGGEALRRISQDGRVEPAEPEATPPAAADENLGRRAERTPRDMAMSLAVLLIPIALILLFYRFVLSGDTPVTVDIAPTIQEAQSAKLFPIAVPSLGDDWHASSATWQRTAAGATLRIGYVDPDQAPVLLIESNVDSQALARTELTASAAPIDRFATGGRTWQLYPGRPGEQALVLFDPDRTIIIVGKTKAENLQALATALS